MIVGYTAGVFDLFHVGHLNILKQAKEVCDKLIVGVTNDELVSYKNKRNVIPFEERAEIVRNIKAVDEVVEQDVIDKYEMWEKVKFDVLIVGDDWKGTPSWNKYEEKLAEVGVKVIYMPYTKHTSSSQLRMALGMLLGL